MFERPHLVMTRLSFGVVPSVQWLWRNGAPFLGIFVIVGYGLVGPLFYPGDPLDTVAPALIAPGMDSAHLLGTDSIGRDMGAGLAHGAGVSLTVGFASALLGLLIGTLLGGIAGYAGGWADRGVTHVTELFQVFPTFLLVLALVGMGGAATGKIVLAISAVSWTTPARVVRSEFRSLRGRDFVLAARGLGYGTTRILFTEILPNCFGSLVAIASVMVASAILTESGLSFLGLGDPNLASWGAMIGDGRDFLRSSPYLVFEPGLAIAATVTALNAASHRLDVLLGRRGALTGG